MSPLVDSRAKARIEAEAAEWILRSESGLSAAESAQFERWLAADVRHGEVFRSLQSTWSRLERPRVAGRAPELVRALAGRKQRRRGRAMAAGAVLLLAGGFFALQRHAGGGSRRAEAPVAAAGILHEVSSQTLADGSVVELKPGATIRVEFEPGHRHVRLTGGEALFTVAKDPTRPFTVTAGGVTVRAVGTVFVVGLDESRVDVIVTEGTVAVRQPAAAVAAAAPIEAFTPAVVGTLVTAGRHLQVERGTESSPPQVAEITPEAIAARLSWREARIEFTRTPLADAVAQLNQRSAIQLVVEDAELARLPVSGIFRTGNTETLVRLLEANFQVETQRSGNIITLRRDRHGR